MDDEGYLTLDALVGLTVTVLALVIVLSAYGATLDMGRRAAAERQGAALGLWVLQTQWPRLNGAGQRDGQGEGGWTWRLQASVTAQQGEVTLCHLQIRVRRPRLVPQQFETDRLCAAS